MDFKKEKDDRRVHLIIGMVGNALGTLLVAAAFYVRWWSWDAWEVHPFPILLLFGVLAIGLSTMALVPAIVDAYRAWRRSG